MVSVGHSGAADKTTQSARRRKRYETSVAEHHGSSAPRAEFQCLMNRLTYLEWNMHYLTVVLQQHDIVMPSRHEQSDHGGISEAVHMDTSNGADQPWASDTATLASQHVTSDVCMLQDTNELNHIGNEYRREGLALTDVLSLGAWRMGLGCSGKYLPSP